MMFDSEEVWSVATRQILRSIRGERSQLAFSRRCGYRSNVAADWEGGHRAPTAHEVFRILEHLGVDTTAAITRFHPPSALSFEPTALHLWLQALRGQAKQQDLARRAHISRHQLGRWLRGDAKPRLPQLLRLVQALTDRGADLVACLVPIEEVPVLAPHWRATRATRRLAYDCPWSAAVLTLLETTTYQQRPAHSDLWVAQRLDVDVSEVQRALEALSRAGLIRRQGRRWQIQGVLTVDMAASPADHRRLKAHWAQVNAARVGDPRHEDLLSFNLFAVSHQDLQRIRELQRSYFRELRQIVAESTPSETVALVTMQVSEWADPG